MKFEIEVTEIKKGQPLPEWLDPGPNSEKRNPYGMWVATISGAGFVGRGAHMSGRGYAFEEAYQDIAFKISDTALAGKPMPVAGAMVDPRCSCASIMEEDRTRHFKGCLMREVYPTHPTCPESVPDTLVLHTAVPAEHGSDETTYATYAGYPRGTKAFSETFSATDGEEPNRDTEPPADPRVGEIHGDDRCYAAIGGAHEWQPATSLQRVLGDTRPEHEAERMNLGVWLACRNCTSSWAEYAEGYPQQERDTNEEPESIRPPEVTC